MKRSLLIGAVATLATGAAMAQSSVTVYGRFNTTVERVKVTDDTGASESTSVLNNNASRLGFKGSEDMGGGLKANFLLEHRFNSDDGSSTSSQFWAGDAWAGLSGGFGEVRLGTQTSTSYYATADWVSMHNHDTGDSADALYYSATGFDGTNKISYITPEMGGLTAELQGQLGEGRAGREKAFDLGVYYKLGALALGLGAEKMGDNKQFGIRAAYTLGDFTFGGYYQRADDDNLTGVVGGAGTRNNFRLSGMYAFGASEIHLNVGKANDWGNLDDSGSTQATVAYNYNLSKMTKVYAYVTQLKNDDGLAAFTGVRKLQAVAAGLRVNF